jgi:DNA-binding CsgD family transcriptional regulator
MRQLTETTGDQGALAAPPRRRWPQWAIPAAGAWSLLYGLLGLYWTLGGGDRLGRAQLTEREAEVLALMARGLSNAEIAGQLTVSLQTVKTHVTNVLAKLQARDRTQAVIAAYDSGFVIPG